MSTNMQGVTAGREFLTSRTMPSIYAGIGARVTPSRVLTIMEKTAHLLARRGWTLRSGGAGGADSAFELGASQMCGHKEIFRPVHSTPRAEALAATYHPAWNRCSAYVRKLHGRNMLIILGADLASPVDCVFCWTVGGAILGGTGMAIRCALDHDIPVFNLAID